ncbi:hypothetical protein Tco_0591828 [Tanacetum coccineum]
MKCKKEDHRTLDHDMYISSLKSSKNYKEQPYQYASPSKQILKAKAKPFPSCTHCGFNDHHPDDYRNYPECEICKSYDHFTSGHNRVIHVRGGVLAESSQSSESSIGVSCTTCRSNVHSTTDHNNFEHFKREGYGSINYGGIVFFKVAFVNGLKYNLISISQLCDAKYIVQFDDKFNTIVTSLKALDESFSSRNHVRKFLRDLPTKWHPKVTTIEEYKDLSTLLLDKLISNLKVYDIVLSDTLYYSSSSLDSESLQNGYNNLCKISLRIINKNKHLKTKNEILDNEVSDLKKRLLRLEKDKEISVECKSCIDLRTKIDSLSLKLAKFENSSHFLQEMIENQRLQKDQKGLRFTKDKALTSRVKRGKMGQETKMPFVEPAPTIPSAMVPSSENAEYRVTISAKETLEPILQKRSEFVKVNKKTSPSAIVGNVKQTPALKLGQGLRKSNIQT